MEESSIINVMCANQSIHYMDMYMHIIGCKCIIMLPEVIIIDIPCSIIL